MKEGKGWITTLHFHPNVLRDLYGFFWYRNRVKVIEDSYHQREERFRQENQELADQYLVHCQNAEQAKSELLAQHQRRLSEVEQEKVKDMDRLRGLQR